MHGPFLPCCLPSSSSIIGPAIRNWLARVFALSPLRLHPESICRLPEPPDNMAAPARSFQFVNAPAAPRTERIPIDIWEKHKAEATKIYLESNIGEVAVQMLLRHNFHARSVFLSASSL